MPRGTVNTLRVQKSITWALVVMNTTESRDFSNSSMVAFSSAARSPRAVTARGERNPRSGGYDQVQVLIDYPHGASALVDGGTLNFDALTAETREAWLQVTATVADGL